MRILSLVLFFILNISLLLKAQTTFNIRESSGFQASGYSSVIEIDSGYLLTGVGVPPSSSLAQAFIKKVDYSGSLIWVKAISGDSSSNIGAYEATLQQLNDSVFVTIGVEFGSNSINKTCFFKYDKNGDTIFVRKYPNPNDYGDFTRGDALTIIDSNQIILGASLQPSSTYDSELLISKVDAEGNIIWETTLNSPSLYYREQWPLLKFINNQIVLVSWYYQHIWATTSNYTFSHRFWWLDSLGNIDSSFTTTYNYPGSFDHWLLGVPRDIIQTLDGGWVIASAWGEEDNSPPVNDVDYDPYVYKLDKNLNLEWDYIIRDDGRNSISELTKVYQLEDSSFVTFGHNFKFLNEQTISQGCWKGMIAKISSSGDSIWNRYYYALCDVGEENLIKDAKPTSDGGFIICGESSGSGAGPYQQGWLLKLDSMGCLVPGCHLVNSIDETSQVPLQIKTYPNPAIDYLNVYVPPIPSSSDLQLHLYNLEGKLLQNHPLPQSDATYMMQVDDLLAGVYLLQLLGGDGSLLGSGKVVIQN